jgi:hypothetical protein
MDFGPGFQKLIWSPWSCPSMIQVSVKCQVDIFCASFFGVIGKLERRLLGSVTAFVFILCNSLLPFPSWDREKNFGLKKWFFFAKKRDLRHFGESCFVLRLRLVFFCSADAGTLWPNAINDRRQVSKNLSWPFRSVKMALEALILTVETFFVCRNKILSAGDLEHRMVESST